MVLGAAYMLYMYRRVVFEKMTKEDLKSILDLSPREIIQFSPLIILVFWMGIYPSSFIEPMSASVANLIENYNTALAAANGGHALAAR